MNRHALRSRLVTRHPVRRRDERGAALLVVMMMLALISALTLTVAMVTTNNLVSARLSQQAGSALNASDAGVAQAVIYLKNHNVRTLNGCSPACPSEPWGNSTNPATVTVNGKAGQKYQVWIEPIAKYPANKPGVYRVHSTGVAGGGAGRSVTADIWISPMPLLFGIVANSIAGGGNAGVQRVSIFSTGCIYKRSQIQFSGIDEAYGVPAAAHTSQVITDDQGSGKTCPGTNKPIHDPTKTGEARYCNPDYPYDEDKFGGPLTSGGACFDRARNATTATPYPGFGALPQFSDSGNPIAYKYLQSSLLADDAALYTRYGVSQPSFTQAQLEQLKSLAMSQGNYRTSATIAPIPSDPDSVLYIDLTAAAANGREVDLNQLAVSPWNRPANLSATDPACPSRSLMVIIEGGDARLNSNSTLAASLFMVSGDPYGNVTKANGTATFTGTISANNLDLTGTSDISLDSCYLANRPPGLSTFATKNYREVDR